MERTEESVYGFVIPTGNRTHDHDRAFTRACPEGLANQLPEGNPVIVDAFIDQERDELTVEGDEPLVDPPSLIFAKGQPTSQ